ncbi:MAG TPA: hypothetical protein VFO85_18410 [Vicinamibacteria bacterium]|nr:hypothetical protein [Vicinamibacteria bacterium]
MAVVAAALLLAELVARWARPHALDDQPQAGLARLHRFSPVYGWELRPGAQARVDGQPTRVNGLGLRGREHPRARTPGRVRLLMLGDSVAFGYGVGEEETFAARLENEGFEVVNLAVPGFGTDQELLRLQREGRRWRPDLVLLHFCVENDPVDNVSRRFFYDGLHPKPYFTLEGGALALHTEELRLSAPARAGLWLRERSFLLQWLRPRPAAPATDWRARKAAALGDGQAARALTRALLARAAEEAAAGGAAFRLVVHPSRESFQQGSPWARDALELPLPAGAPALDMAAAYKARGLRFRELTLDSIGHLSPRGHAAAAAVLAEALRPSAPAAAAPAPPR